MYFLLTFDNKNVLYNYLWGKKIDGSQKGEGKEDQVERREEEEKRKKLVHNLGLKV